MIRSLARSLALLLVVTACSSSDPAPAAPPGPSLVDRDKALAVQREISSEAARRIGAGEDATVVVADLRRQIETHPSLFDVSSIVVSQSGRSLAVRTAAEKLPLIFFANRYLPSIQYSPKPLERTTVARDPSTIPSTIVLDPESSRPKLGMNYATSGSDIATLLRSWNTPSDKLVHRTADFVLDDYRKVTDHGALYFQGHGDGFGDFGAIASGVPTGTDPNAFIDALTRSGDLKLGGAFSDQRVMLTMDLGEAVLTHRFFESMTKAPRVVFLNGFPSGTPNHFANVFTTRGTEHFLSSLVKAWNPDVDYLALRTFEELFSGHDLRKVAELRLPIEGGTLHYHGPGSLFVACGPECRKSCIDIFTPCFDDEPAARELCDRIADNASALDAEQLADPPAANDPAESLKKHATDDGVAITAPQENAAPPAATAGCTKAKLDVELATWRNLYKPYVTKLGSSFRGCLDITQDLHFVFRFAVPKFVCWTPGIAWRLTIIHNPFWCQSNFMHNAFLLTPKTYEFGHKPTVFDPYELSDGTPHTPREQDMMQFVGDATAGGAEHGRSNVTWEGERARAQHTIDFNADHPDCDWIYKCLNEEFEQREGRANSPKVPLRNSCK